QTSADRKTTPWIGRFPRAVRGGECGARARTSGDRAVPVRSHRPGIRIADAIDALSAWAAETGNCWRIDMARQWLSGLAAVFFLAALSACNEWGPHEPVASPSSDPSLTATIRSPLLQTIGDQNTNALTEGQFACSQNNQFTGPIDIAMTAGQNVNLNQVAI